MKRHRVIVLFILLSLLFAPFSSFSGVKQVTAAVDDSNLSADVQSLPVAYPLALTVQQGYYMGMELTGSDADGDPLTFVITSLPQHGELYDLDYAPFVTYRSDPDYVGTDTFQFVVTDGFGESAPATVTITVRTNEKPVANPLALTVQQGYYMGMELTGSDADGDPLTFVVTSLPQHGELYDLDYAPFVTYRSDPDYVGTDTFQFVVTDGFGESAPATVTITVRTNEKPVANPLALTVQQGYYMGMELTGSDADGDPLTFVVTSLPQHGDLYDLDYAPFVTYRSDPDYVGTDTFQFVVTDGFGESAPATVTITVRTNEKPVANPLALTVQQGYYMGMELTGSDADGDPLTFVITSLPQHGELYDLDYAPFVTYRSDPDYVGTDTFQFVVTDGFGESAPATVTITVRTNEKPVANPLALTVQQGYYMGMELTGSDADGDPLTFVVTSLPQHGDLYDLDYAPFVTYRSDPDYVGTDTFQFVVTDGFGESAPATVTITVRTNAKPIADSQDLVAKQGEVTPILLTGSDADGDPISFIIIDGPDHGILTGDAPNLAYQSDPDYVGIDTFQFVVIDGFGKSDVATVSISVEPAGPTTVFSDDFETNLGWVRNPYGTDTAKNGKWERAIPQYTWWLGYKQLGRTVSGRNDLVTGARAGWDPGDYDVDSGITTILSPRITLPTGRNLELSLSYYFAHASNSSSSDFLKIKIIGQTTVTIFEERGAQNDDDAAWASFTTSLNSFAGQSIYILIETADYSSASLVEAAIDDVLIVAH